MAAGTTSTMSVNPGVPCRNRLAYGMGEGEHVVQSPDLDQHRMLPAGQQGAVLGHDAKGRISTPASEPAPCVRQPPSPPRPG